MYARGDASDLLMDREDNQEHLALLVPRRKQSETHWDPRRRIGDRGAVLADWLCGRTAAFGTHADSYKVHLDGQYKKNTLRRSYVDRQNVVIGTYPTKYAARTLFEHITEPNFAKYQPWRLAQVARAPEVGTLNSLGVSDDYPEDPEIRLEIALSTNAE